MRINRNMEVNKTYIVTVKWQPRQGQEPLTFKDEHGEFNDRKVIYQGQDDIGIHKFLDVELNKVRRVNPRAIIDYKEVKEEESNEDPKTIEGGKQKRKTHRSMTHKKRKVKKSKGKKHTKKH